MMRGLNNGDQSHSSPQVTGENIEKSVTNSQDPNYGDAIPGPVENLPAIAGMYFNISPKS